MEKYIIQIAPDRQRAKSMVKMANQTLMFIKTIDTKRFPSHVLKAYYDVIRILMQSILLVEGYKVKSSKPHKDLIVYLEKYYRQLTEADITLVNYLRITRNKIAYDGFFVNASYLKRNKQAIHKLIKKLKKVIHERLEN